jgi:hypothetical protein
VQLTHHGQADLDILFLGSLLRPQIGDLANGFGTTQGGTANGLCNEQ